MNLQILKEFLKKSGILAKPNFSKEHLDLCSEFFCADSYRESIGDTSISDADALKHYLSVGWLEGVDPSPKFSTSGYLGLYPDVAEAGINPLLHYVVHGILEDRLIYIPENGTNISIEELTPHRIQGFAINKGNPCELIHLSLFIDGVFHSNLNNDVTRNDLRVRGVGVGKGGFQADIPFYLLEIGSHLVEVVAPDGTRLGREILLEKRGKSPNQQLSRTPPAKVCGHIKVIVPIYNAVEDVIVCIDRLRAHTPDGVEILLIDDCSPDPKIGDVLDALKSENRFQILRNPENLGFTRTVNRGFAECGEADIIILNSDARVTPRWVEGLYAAAYVRDRVATVTAMSDRAGAFSAPNIGNENPLPAGVDEISYARAFRRRSLRLYPEVPTGNGFCMYIRRAAIDEIGPLDADAFPRGYGEENDFCMRALRAGWVNIIDDATYVFHERTKSFGAEKSNNIAAGRAVVDARYPEYKVLIRKFHESNLICLARFRARQALVDCSAGGGVLPRALFVLATRTGGTPQTNADLMDAFAETFECWVLRSDSKTLELSFYHAGRTELLYSYVLTEPIDPVTHRSSEYDAVLADWLEEISPEIVHIRHLAWHSLALPALAHQASARVVYSLHDFYTLCPSLKLLDDQSNFCEGQCSTGSGNCKIELWPVDSLPPVKNGWVHQWRDNMEQALAFCDAFVTTSHSARERFLRFLPSLSAEHFHVIPHGRDFSRFEHLQHFPDGDGPVKVLIPGNIDEAKGLSLIVELLRLDHLRTFEFHVLGGVHLSWLKGAKVPRLHLHDRYQRADFAEKVRKIAPHFGVVLSIWDETYCHTLTEMWSVGLPVAVLDFPTLRSRVNDSGAGWVLQNRDPKAVYEELRAIASDREDLIAKGTAAIRWQMERGAAQSCRQMASRYLDVYRKSGVGHELPKVAVVCPADRGLRTAFASTEIRIWERTRNGLARPLNYIRTSVNGLIAQMRMGTVAGAIIQRTAIPASLVDSFLETARETGTPYIFELDDNLLKVPSDKDADGFYAAYAPLLKRLLRAAAAVTVSTETLAVEMRAFNENVRVVPNRVSARLWGGQQSGVISRERRLLYMGTKTHEEDLTFLISAMERARSTLPELRLKMIGVTGRRDLPEWVDAIEIPEDVKTYSKFVPWLREQARDTVLAVAPLMTSEFNRFKSALKILDYGALGLPVLASQVECYEALVGSEQPKGVTLLRNSQDAWAREIISKLRNIAALPEEGGALRAWVFKHHGLEPSLAEYDDFVLRSLERRV